MTTFMVGGEQVFLDENLFVITQERKVVSGRLRKTDKRIVVPARLTGTRYFRGEYGGVECTVDVVAEIPVSVNGCQVTTHVVLKEIPEQDVSSDRKILDRRLATKNAG